jgi:hypothetical protein
LVSQICLLKILQIRGIIILKKHPVLWKIFNGMNEELSVLKK